MWIVGVLIAEAFGALLWLVNESVYFTEDYVRRFGPCRCKVELDWAEVDSLNVTHDGDLVLANSDGRKICVHNDLHGQHVFLATLRRVIRRDLIESKEDDSAELERLVC